MSEPATDRLASSEGRPIDSRRSREHAERTPEAIAADIAQTRDRLAGTIDQLVYRAQPKTISANRQLDPAMRRSLLLKDDGWLDPAKVTKLAGGLCWDSWPSSS